MNTTSKWLAIAAAAFVAGSFVASPELRAYAANTVFSTDIVDGEVKTADLANNAVTAGKIKDAEVKAAEIAADAVGGSEIQGVTKLLFGQCAANSDEGTKTVLAGEGVSVTCSINGVDSDDSAVAEVNSATTCFEVYKAVTETNAVKVGVINDCKFSSTFGTGSKIGIIVFDK
jgi:hypothetical protein